MDTFITQVHYNTVDSKGSARGRIHNLQRAADPGGSFNHKQSPSLMEKCAKFVLACTMAVTYRYSSSLVLY